MDKGSEVILITMVHFCLKTIFVLTGKNGINFDRSNASSAIIRNNTIYFNGTHDLVQDISESIEGNPRHGGQKVAGIKALRQKCNCCKQYC